MNKQNSIAVGLLRPPHIFFFEVDNLKMKTRLLKLCCKHLKYFSIYATKRGYHVIGYPFRKRIWRIFKRKIKTDFTMRLEARFNMPRYRPQILRTSPKFDKKSGKIVSAAPKKIHGNLELLNVKKYKRMYPSYK